MAELRIQPKKSSPSPWLVVALAVLLLAAAAYAYLRLNKADEPMPHQTEIGTPLVPIDSLAQNSAGASAPSPPVPDSVAAGLASEARTMLLNLSPKLTQLADRADLRDDAAIREQRDNYTSATARLADGDPRAGLRPGLVAAANLLLAVQQKGYPNLQTEVSALSLQANQLSGRDATPDEQAQNRAYLTQLTTLLNTMSYPAKDVL
ncbi:hypothetical protein A0257_19140 [Hymenobacter psoromatis]|nr:hypothetical protein A0257_19140 [Hymenobacter psoromatis]